MPPLRRIGRPEVGYVGSKKLLRYNHRLVVGAAMAVSSQDTAKDSGVIAAPTPTETGRLTLTFSGGQKHKRFRGGSVTLIGPDDASYGALTVGLHSVFRDDDLAVDGTLELQFLNSSGNFTDAALPSGTVVIVDLAMEI